MQTLIVIITAIFGLIIGSFLNVVVLRMNTGRGIGGRSQCFSCNKILEWYELIPVVSYIIQGGKCRKCRSKISPQYMLVELATAILFAGVALRFDIISHPFSALLIFLMIALGVVIATYDVLHMTIPEVPLIGFFGVSIALGMHGIGFLLVPLPFLILWLISRGKWIGFGDVELMACMGMLLGVVSGVSAVMLSFWVACVVVLPWFGIQKLRGKSMNHHIPFGPFLLIGTYLVAIGGLDVLKLISGVIK